ncbi:hypothetical protein OAN24_00290 [Pseudodesulfovibrio sp.]|nr:hypothetical protein [Pseudodesulfovibrio sp.]
MNRTLFRSCIITAAALILPGCLAINALLGVAGFLTTGPIQYAGTAYSIGEYSYEYAVNDKTPDEVIEEKFALFFDVEPDPAMKGYAKALGTTTMAKVTPKALPKRQPIEPSLAAAPRVTLTPTSQTAPIMVATLRTRTPHQAPARPTPVRKQVTREAPAPVTPKPIVQTAVIMPTPQHTYVERQRDPLLEKLARMEQTLAQAEQVMNQEPSHGVRYSISTEEAGQTGTGISGSWSIRHGVMQANPDALPASVGSVVETGPDQILHIAS